MASKKRGFWHSKLSGKSRKPLWLVPFGAKIDAPQNYLGAYKWTKPKQFNCVRAQKSFSWRKMGDKVVVTRSNYLVIRTLNLFSWH
jgi:hypothetical protein